MSCQRWMTQRTTTARARPPARSLSHSPFAAAATWRQVAVRGLDFLMRSAADSWHLPWLGLYLFGCSVAAGVGGLSTTRVIPTWYRRLHKPGWTPPDGVFGAVWTLL